MMKIYKTFFVLGFMTFLQGTTIFGQRPWIELEATESLIPETPISGSSIWSEDFEGATAFPFNGITTSTLGSDGGFKISTSSGSAWNIPSHTTYALTNDDLCNCDKSNDILQLPTQNFTSHQAILIECDIFHDMSSGDGVVYLQIDTGNGWQTIDSVGATNQWRLFQKGLPGAGGKSSYDIRFRYDDSGAWATGCAIDNIRLVEPSKKYDAQLSKPWTDELPIMEISAYQQAGKPLNLGISSENIGQLNLSNLETIKLITGQNNGRGIFNAVSLPPAEEKLLTVQYPFWFGPELGNYRITTFLNQDSLTPDQNDTLHTDLYVTDSTMSHDLSAFDTTALWFGPGIQYQLSHSFSFNKPDTITSAYVYIDEQTADNSSLNLWLYDAADSPLKFVFNVPITQQDLGKYKLIQIPPTPVDSGICKLGIESNSDSVILKCAALPFVSKNARLRINNNLSQTRFLVIAGLNTKQKNCDAAVSINKYPATCNSSDGSLSADFGNSWKTIQWKWNDTTVNNVDSLSMISPGIYHLTAMDTLGCTVKRAIGLSAVNNIQIDSVVTDPSQCSDDTTGSIVIYANGNQLRYQLNDLIPKSDSSFTGLKAGDYEISIWEASSPTCKSIESAKVSGGRSPLTVTFKTTDNRCSEETNGRILAQVRGGVQPYDFSWGSDTSNSPVQNDLTSGIYVLTVTDDVGCSTTASGMVSSLPPISIAPVDNDQLGFIVLNASGGVGSLDYNWSGPNGYRNPGTDSIGGLISKGTYRVTITDDASCQLETSFNMQGAISIGESETTTKYRIYPNPANEFLNVESSIMVSVSLYSINGRELFKSNLKSSHRIDISEYPSGMYFLSVESEIRKTYKIIKQ